MFPIQFPAFLTIRNANSIIQRCENAFSSSDKKVCFDLSRCSFSDPFGTTLVAGAMIACIKKGHEVVYRNSKNNRLEQHFKRIGFYEFGKSEIGKTKYSGRQVELNYLKALDPTYTSAVIQVLEGSLNMSQGVKDSLHVCINELMTNTFDHSETVLGCFACAQAYTYNGEVKICLTDFGRGILKTLKQVPEYKHLKNSIEAIELAIQNGVTSRIGVRAGLGLDHIHRFLRVNNGQIHIISGDGWVHWNYQNGNGVIIKRKKLDIAFEGTIVNIIAKADGEGFYILSSENTEEQIF
jgi:anti-anti-sigma regulatory factor